MIGLLLLMTGGILAALSLSSLLVPANATVVARVAQLESPALERRHAGLHGLGIWLDPLVKHLAITRNIDKRLEHLGLAWTPGEFLLISALCGLAGGVALGLLSPSPASVLAGAACGACLPFGYLGKLRRDRLKAFNLQLPDAIMLIVNALRSGNGFLQALQLVGRQMPEPISVEFEKAVLDINWGIPMETALLSLQERIGTVDIELVISAVLIQRESGGNLAEILSNIHDAIRDRTRIQGEVQSLTAQGRLSGWILGGLPVALALLFWAISPSYIRTLFTDPRGHMMVAGAIGMEILGLLTIRRIVNIRY